MLAKFSKNIVEWQEAEREKKIEKADKQQEKDDKKHEKSVKAATSGTFVAVALDDTGPAFPDTIEEEEVNVSCIALSQLQGSSHPCSLITAGARYRSTGLQGTASGASGLP